MADKTEALKDLYTRLIDSHDGYEQASKLADQSAHKQLFSSQIERRARNAQEVKQFLAKAGTQIDDDGSLLAAAHRTWLSLKDTVTSGDDKILAEVIRGEEELLSTYDKAIAAAGAGDPELNWLSDQYTDLKMLVEDLKGRESRAAA